MRDSMAVDAPDWVQGDGSVQDRLTLADWRRRMSGLYAEVRAMTATDAAVGLAHWRSAREWLFREHPQSPLPRAERADFRARHFDHDPALRFVVPVEPAPAEDPGALAMQLPNSGADTLSFRRIGTVRLPFPDGEQRLSVFWMAGYAGGLFIPFRDATNGRETYGAGRYMYTGLPKNGRVTLDFNRAINPPCAFTNFATCPLPPSSNRLSLPIEAGELDYRP